MGGLFRAPRPPVVVPPPAPPPQVAAAPPPAPAAVAEGAREETGRRRRQGLAGTILTSERGVLDPATPFAAQRRSLLGE